MPRTKTSLGVTLVACLGAWMLPVAARGEVISKSVPFESPKGDYVTQQDRYHTFRIPGMVVAPPLFIYRENGDYTTEIEKMFRP